MLPNASTLLLLLPLASCINFKPFEFKVPFVATDRAPFLSKKVLVVNRVDSNFEHIKNDNHRIIMKAGLDSFIAALVVSIGTCGADDIAVIRAWNPIEHENPYRVLDTAKIAAIAQDSGAHYVLTVNEYDAKIYQDRVEVERDYNGDKIRTAYYDLKMETNSILYNHSGTLLQHYPSGDTIPYDERWVISGLLAFGPAYTKAKNTICTLSAMLAHKITEPYRDHMVAVSTNMLITKPLREVEKLMRHAQWDAAEELLEQYMKITENTREQGRAAYNLAIVQFAKGQFDLYYEYSDMALSKAGVSPSFSEATPFRYK